MGAIRETVGEREQIPRVLVNRYEIEKEKGTVIYEGKFFGFELSDMGYMCGDKGIHAHLMGYFSIEKLLRKLENFKKLKFSFSNPNWFYFERGEALKERSIWHVDNDDTNVDGRNIFRLDGEDEHSGWRTYREYLKHLALRQGIMIEDELLEKVFGPLDKEIKKFLG